MRMKNPAHPGRIVRHDCLEPLRLSVTEGAKILGVTRQALNNVVNGKSGISPGMAIRLTKAFGSTPETWLRMQLAYELAAALKKTKPKSRCAASMWRNFMRNDLPGAILAGVRKYPEDRTQVPGLLSDMKDFGGGRRCASQLPADTVTTPFTG
jgi:addiction module HigA family antidote